MLTIRISSRFNPNSKCVEVVPSLGVSKFPDHRGASTDFIQRLDGSHKKRDYGSVKSRRIGTIALNLDNLEENFRSGNVLWILARLEYEDVFGSKFFYSEKIHLSPNNASLNVGIHDKKPVGFAINSEGVWGKVEDGRKHPSV
jgi:hypothetical protein